MTIKDKDLQSFFLKQRKASIDCLVNREKIGIKRVAIRQQTGSNQAEERVANGKQTGSNQVSEQVANGQQTGSEIYGLKDVKNVTGSNQVAERVAERVANGQQTGSKLIENDNTDIVVGNERSLLLYIFKKCQLIGSLETNPITLEELSSILKINRNHAKNLIFRMIKKGIINVSEMKEGRGGWRKYTLTSPVFQKLIMSENISKSVANGQQTGSNQVAERVAERVANTSSSSSIYNYSKTTTTNEGITEISRALPDDWKAIDISRLSEHGFTVTHLSQIFDRTTLDPGIVQDSINYFSFDLSRNNKRASIKGDVINFFMGILAKGRPYTRPANYISEAEESMNAYLESKDVELRRIQELQQKIQDSEFIVWSSTLSDKDMAEILPTALTGGASDKIPPMALQTLKTRNLKKHFVETVLPEVLRKLRRTEIEAQGSI